MKFQVIYSFDGDISFRNGTLNKKKHRIFYTFILPIFARKFLEVFKLLVHNIRKTCPEIRLL